MAWRAFGKGLEIAKKLHSGLGGKEKAKKAKFAESQKAKFGGSEGSGKGQKAKFCRLEGVEKPKSQIWWGRKTPKNQICGLGGGLEKAEKPNLRAWRGSGEGRPKSQMGGAGRGRANTKTRTVLGLELGWS